MLLTQTWALQQAKSILQKGEYVGFSHVVSNNDVTILWIRFGANRCASSQLQLQLQCALCCTRNMHACIVVQMILAFNALRVWQFRRYHRVTAFWTCVDTRAVSMDHIPIQFGVLVFPRDCTLIVVGTWLGWCKSSVCASQAFMGSVQWWCQRDSFNLHGTHEDFLTFAWLQATFCISVSSCTLERDWRASTKGLKRYNIDHWPLKGVIIL